MCVACNPGLVSFLEMAVSRRKVLGGAVLSTAPLWMPKARAQGPRADVLFRNGTVITMDPSRPRAQALAVSGGKIMAVGSEDDLEGLRSPQTRIIDLSGGTLLTGLIDPHMHTIFVLFESWIDASPFANATVEQVVARLKAAVAKERRALGSERGSSTHRSRQAKHISTWRCSTRSRRTIRSICSRATATLRMSTRRRWRSPALHAIRPIHRRPASDATPTAI